MIDAGWRLWCQWYTPLFASAYVGIQSKHIVFFLPPFPPSYLLSLLSYFLFSLSLSPPSVPPSFPPSLPLSLPSFLPPFLPPSLPPSLPLSLPSSTRVLEKRLLPLTWPKPSVKLGSSIRRENRGGGPMSQSSTRSLLFAATLNFELHLMNT